MLKSVFLKISPHLPRKVNIKLIAISSRIGFGGKYLYRYYQFNSNSKNTTIENYFHNKYPELNSSIRNKHTRSSKSNKNKGEIKKNTTHSEHSIDELSGLIQTNFDQAKKLYNTIASRTPNLATFHIATLEMSKNEHFFQYNQKIVCSSIRYLIEKRETKALLRYFKFIYANNINHNLLSQLSYFYYKNPTNSGLVAFLGDIEKNNENFMQSLNFYTALKGLNTYYGAAKIASLMADFNEVQKLEETVQELLTLKIPEKEMFRVLPMLLRVTPKLEDPLLKEQVFALRDDFGESLVRKPNNEKTSSAIVRIRFLQGYKTLDQDFLLSITPSSVDLDDYINFASLAYYNDSSEDLACINDGIVTYLDKESISNNKNTVEVFLPTFLFNLDESKEIYKTLRRFYGNLINFMYRSNKITVIPRMQYNWRYVDPISNNKIISYHTVWSGEENRLVIQESTLSNRVSIDEKGYAGFSHFSDLENTIEASTEDTLKYIEDFKNNRFSKYEQANTNEEVDGAYVFMPLQVESDAVSKLRHFEVDKALNVAVAFTKEHNLKLVIKRHPYCRSNHIKQLVSRLKSENEHVIESVASIHNLIEHSKFTLTANSGVGLESLMYGKPVVTFGKSDYSFAAIECYSVNDLESKLTLALSDLEVDHTSFIDHYLHRYTVDVDQEKTIDNRLAALLD